MKTGLTSALYSDLFLWFMFLFFFLMQTNKSLGWLGNKRFTIFTDMNDGPSVFLTVLSFTFIHNRIISKFHFVLSLFDFNLIIYF